jgi:hypothetical protein
MRLSLWLSSVVGTSDTSDCIGFLQILPCARMGMPVTMDESLGDLAIDALEFVRQVEPALD